MKLLHFIILLTLMLSSCESEYQRQLKKAKELVNKEIFLKNSSNGQDDISSGSSLSTIREEIEYCAHVSGNKKFFLKELDTYRTSVQDSPGQNEWLSRYP